MATRPVTKHWSVFPPFSARIAVTATWYLNRRWVFDRQAVQMSGREYGSYVVVQVIGAMINLLVFVAAIELVDELLRIPAIPLAMGSAVALFFNFFASGRFVFADGPGEKTEEPSQ